MERVMAIVSQARLTMAIIGVSFFRGSITIAKAVSLGLLMYNRTGGPFITCRNRKALYYLAENHAYFFVKVPCLFG